MANPKHLAILAQGTEAWNHWRAEHPRIRPDLSDVDFSEIGPLGEVFADAWAAGAGLTGADFMHADLHGVNFSGANLSGGIFFRADLTGADLTHVVLQRADLEEASLRAANLRETDFGGAQLRETDLTGATLGWTQFRENDLSLVKGLNDVRHLGPSRIDIDSIYRSRGAILEAFLRGAGVPDSFVAFNRLLRGKPYQYYSCFISYSARDESFAAKLHGNLQASEVRCWFAPHDLKIGAKIRVGLDQAIGSHEKLLLVLSKHSVRSDWVEQEVETALERERKLQKLVLLPIRVDDAIMEIPSGWPALIRNTRNIGDFKRWRHSDAFQIAFARLLRDLVVEET